MVIIPPKFLDEIKALPEDILSFQKQVSERFLGKYTGLGVSDTLVHSVKVRIFSFNASEIDVADDNDSEGRFDQEYWSHLE